MGLKIVHRSAGFGPARLVDPPRSGYLHAAAVVAPPPGRSPRPGNTPGKETLIRSLKADAAELAGLNAVSRADVYRAVLIPPPAGFSRQAGHRARFDVVVLVETGSPGDIAEVEGSPAFKHVLDLLHDASPDVHVMAARCRKSLGDVDRSRPGGVFLFNYFVGADPAVSYELWDHLAGWYAAETGLDNSVLLEPLGDADYWFVNHARFDQSLPALILRQFAKPGFYRFVQGNLRANRTGAMPLFYRLA